MRNFKILNNIVSFDDEIGIYRIILQKAIDYRTDFLFRYIETNKFQVNSTSEYTSYLIKMRSYFEEEINSIANSIKKIYVDYKVYNITVQQIKEQNLSNIVEAEKVFQEMTLTAQNMEDAINQLKIDTYQSIGNQVNDSVRGLYFDVYSPHYSDIMMNEWFNNREKKRVERKRAKIYQNQISNSDKDIERRFLYRAQLERKNNHKQIRNAIEYLIDAMYKNCIADLIDRGIISNGILDNLKTEEAKAISENLNLITDKSELEKQLALALQLDPYIYETHIKVIENIQDYDLHEYIELIKFLHAEDEIFKIYLSDRENKKSFEIIKKLIDNMNIDHVLGQLISRNEYTGESISVDISYTEDCFKVVKEFWGNDNKEINEVEKEIFNYFIKFISAGTNLVYDGCLDRVDYKKLNDFLLKRVSLDKKNEIKGEILSAVIQWIFNHKKLILIIIILILLLIFGQGDSEKKDNSVDLNLLETNVEKVQEEDRYITPANVNLDGGWEAPDYYDPGLY